MEQIELENAINDKFITCFKHVLSIYKRSLSNAGETVDLTVHPLIIAIRSIYTRYNPTEMLMPKQIVTVSKFYNSDAMLRNFINRLHFTFVNSIGVEQWQALVRRLAFSMTLKLGPASNSLLTDEMHGSYNTADDNLELLSNNPHIAIFAMIILTGTDDHAIG